MLLACVGAVLYDCRMTNNEHPASRLARLVYNPDDRTDLVDAVRNNDTETIDAITDDPEIIAAARAVVAIESN